MSGLQEENSVGCGMKKHACVHGSLNLSEKSNLPGIRKKTLWDVSLKMLFQSLLSQFRYWVLMKKNRLRLVWIDVIFYQNIKTTSPQCFEFFRFTMFKCFKCLPMSHNSELRMQWAKANTAILDQSLTTRPYSVQLTISQLSLGRSSLSFTTNFTCSTITKKDSLQNFAETISIQSCEMSNLLHRANLSNQILPQEERVNLDKFRA